MSDDYRKVYIGGLPFRHTKEDLYDMFEKYGKVEDAFIIRDRETGRSRGFGFVVFENEDSMDEAISALNNTELDGRNLIVERAGKRRSGGYRRGGGDRGYRGGYRSSNRDYGREGYNTDRRYGGSGGGGGRRNYDDGY